MASGRSAYPYVLLALLTSWCRGSLAEPTLDTKNLHFPSAYGFYVLDGGTFTQLNNKFVATTAEQAKRYLTFSKEARVLIYNKWVRDSSKAKDVVLNDAGHTGEDPMLHVPTAIKQLEGHAEMLLIVPTQPLDASVYSIKCGKTMQDYEFGVNTPDLTAFWKEVAQKHPTSWQARNHYGTMLYLSGDVRGALEQYLKAVELKPDNCECQQNLALAYSALGQTDSAIQHYEIAAKIADNTVVLTNLANAYVQAKRFDDAIKSYRQALLLDPNNPQAHCNLGWVLMQENKIEDAIPEFRRAIDLDPNLSTAKTDLEQALKRK